MSTFLMTYTVAERTESGKIVKGELRKLAKTIWESRSKDEKPKL